MKVGIFDSGVGGVSMANAIKAQLPGLELVIKSDKEHFPYGNRSLEDIYEFTKPLVKQLIDEDCAAVVIACNTVTTNLISRLRHDFEVPMVGMEPMVKPAAELSRTGVIAVCATPRTLASARYAQLKEEYASTVKVLEPDCSDWAYMIENNSVDLQKISRTIDLACRDGADVIVLGCTHYHWIEELIKDAAGDRAQVLQPEEPVIKQLSSVLSRLA